MFAAGRLGHSHAIRCALREGGSWLHHYRAPVVPTDTLDCLVDGITMAFMLCAYEHGGACLFMARMAGHVTFGGQVAARNSLLTLVRSFCDIAVTAGYSPHRTTTYLQALALFDGDILRFRCVAEQRISHIRVHFCRCRLRRTFPRVRRALPTAVAAARASCASRASAAPP